MGIGSFLFGGKKKYDMTAEKNAAQGVGFGLAGRLGAQYQGMEKGQPVFDWSQTGKPVGVSEATRDYDFSPIDQAIRQFKRPSLFKQTYDPAQFTASYTASSYNPYKFNFGDDSKINDITNNQYSLGASDLTRASRDNLERIREAAGVRRPGLLLKSAEDSNRDLMGNLTRMRTELGTNAANRMLDLGQAQQVAQAGENLRGADFNAGEALKSANFLFGREQAQAGEGYKGYQSRADLERANEANRLTNAQNLASTGQNKIQTQAQITQEKQAEQDRILQMLQEYFTNFMTTRRGGQAAQRGGGLFGTLVNAGAKVASSAV